MGQKGCLAGCGNAAQVPWAAFPRGAPGKLENLPRSGCDRSSREVWQAGRPQSPLTATPPTLGGLPKSAACVCACPLFQQSAYQDDAQDVTDQCFPFPICA